MTKSWRPEGWESPHRFVLIPPLLELAEAQDTDAVKYYQNEFYELGADAMLEALRNSIEAKSSELAYRALAYKNKHPYRPAMLYGEIGKWVFIPDDKEEE